jgi:hypothetical protein
MLCVASPLAQHGRAPVGSHGDPAKHGSRALMLMSQHLAAPQHTIPMVASAAAVGAAAAAAKVPAGSLARILWGPPCCLDAAWGVHPTYAGGREVPVCVLAARETGSPAAAVPIRRVPLCPHGAMQLIRVSTAGPCLHSQDNLAGRLYCAGLMAGRHVRHRCLSWVGTYDLNRWRVHAHPHPRRRLYPARGVYLPILCVRVAAGPVLCTPLVHGQPPTAS